MSSRRAISIVKRGHILSRPRGTVSGTSPVAALCTAALLTVLAAGCAQFPPQGQQRTPSEPPRPNVNLSGYSAAFKQGYSDGCESAGGRQRRNDQQYKTEPDYAMGWNDGHSICGKNR